MYPQDDIMCPEYFETKEDRRRRLEPVTLDVSFCSLLRLKSLIWWSGRWTQGADARNEMHQEVWCRHLTASSWSLIGAANFVTPTFRENEDLLQWLEKQIPPFETLRDWNDDPERTHNDIRDAIKRALNAVQEAIQEQEGRKVNEMLSRR